MILGYSDIFRITHDVEDALVVLIERKMTFDDPRPTQALEIFSRLRIDRRNDLVRFQERHRLFVMNQAGHEKTRPGITGFRVGHDEGIVWESTQVSSSRIVAQQMPSERSKFSDHGSFNSIEILAPFHNLVYLSTAPAMALYFGGPGAPFQFARKRARRRLRLRSRNRS